MDPAGTFTVAPGIIIVTAYLGPCIAQALAVTPSTTASSTTVPPFLTPLLSSLIPAFTIGPYHP